MTLLPQKNSKSQLEYLGNVHFAAVILLVFFLHLLAGYGWSIIPRAKILDIPVRMLNIRLGDVDAQEQEDIPPIIVDNTTQLESAESKQIRPKLPKPIPQKPTPPKPIPINNNLETPKQFVRALPTENTNKNNGIALGNSTSSNAEIKANYEQTVSLWIKKFQFYPDEAREMGLKGSPVVRIRIDRRGNIRSNLIETSSGYEELDRAALDMVRRANPVPAVPDDYPLGEAFDFLIPVTFE